MSLLSPFSKILSKLAGSNQASIAVPVQEGNELTKNPTQTVELQRVLAALREKHPVVLLHGRAGTGKTTLIQSLQESGLRYAVVAPTGIAARNAGGVTAHSFFGLQLGIADLDKIEPRHKLRSILRRLDLLVIDEISMVRADVLDAIDKTMRVNRDATKPFGGVQVLMAGDFLQLPPITREEQGETLQTKGYETFYAFGAHCLRELNPKVIELTTVYRQNDPKFLELLGDLRLGRNVEASIKHLNEASHREHRPEAKPLLLTSTKNVAEVYNRAGLAQIAGPATTFRGVVKDKFNPRDYPAPEELQLKVNARIMLVRNDPEKRWVNGSLGTVTKLSDSHVWVKLDGSEDQHQIDTVTWEQYEYQPDSTSPKLKQVVVGSYSQLPIQQAWAINIHKCQGLTLDDVRIDLGLGAFEKGQTYVALSRVRTLNGLSFAQPLQLSDIKVDANLVEGVQGMVQGH